MRMSPAPLDAARERMAGSSVAPETSLMISAPASRAARATSASVVSMLMGMVPRMPPSALIALIAGTTRAICSCALTRLAPGRVDSPPMSSASAPARAAWCAARTASAGVWRSPPS